jgi:hypothetical protein
MLALVPTEIKLPAHKEMTLMSGKNFVITFSPTMDEDTALVQADLIRRQESKTGRTHAISHAIEHLHKVVKTVPRSTLESLIEAFALDTVKSPPETRPQRGMWLSHEATEMIKEIGAYLESLNSKSLPEEDRLFIPKLLASKSGYNQTLIVYFALRILTAAIRAEHPDLQPVEAEDVGEERRRGGRSKADPAEILAKYPLIIELLKSGMTPNDIYKHPDVAVSLNTIKKVQKLLDEE